MRVPIYAFPLLIQHSLRHDDAQVRAVLWTASRLAANFLNQNLIVGHVHRLRSVSYMQTKRVLFFPAVDGRVPMPVQHGRITTSYGERLP